MFTFQDKRKRDLDSESDEDRCPKVGVRFPTSSDSDSNVM
jgi:hypothetical protein